MTCNCAFHGTKFHAIGEPGKYIVARVHITDQCQITIEPGEDQFPTLAAAERQAASIRRGNRAFIAGYRLNGKA